MVFVEICIALFLGLLVFVLLAWVAVSVLDAGNDEMPGIVETLTGMRARRLKRAAQAAKAAPAPDA